MEYLNEATGQMEDLSLDGSVRGQAPVEQPLDAAQTAPEDAPGDAASTEGNDEGVLPGLENAPVQEHVPKGESQVDRIVREETVRLDKELSEMTVEPEAGEEEVPENDERLVEEVAGQEPEALANYVDQSASISYGSARMGRDDAIRLMKLQGLTINENSEIMKDNVPVGKILYDRSGISGRAKNIRIKKY